jgi:HEAT repeat protein
MGTACKRLLLIAPFLALALAAEPAADKDKEKPKGPRDGLVAGKTLSMVVREIQDKDPSVREAAIRAIPLFGPEGREAAPYLIAELKDNDTGLKSHAAIALGLVGVDERDMKKGIDALTLLLGDPQSVVRMQAATTLARFGPEAASAIPKLGGLIKDVSSWEVRKAACFALGTTAQDPRNGPHKQVIVALTNALGDLSAPVRLEASTALVLLGPPADTATRMSAVAALQKLARDRDDGVVIWSRMAIMRLDKVSNANLTTIAKFLRSPEGPARLQAVRALAMVGREASAFAGELEQTAASDKEPAVILAALGALTTLGPEGQASLQKLAKHDNEDIRKAAQEALDSMKPVGKPKAGK